MEKFKNLYTVKQDQAKLRLSTVIERQFDPSFSMLEGIIDNCSKAIWSQKNISPQFWQQVYHVLYGLDYWFSKSEQDFLPPEGSENLSPDLGEISEKTADKEWMKNYLNEVRAKVENYLENIDDEQLLQVSPLYKKWTNFDVLLDQLRHLQHHIGFLNLLLRKCGSTPAAWYSFGVDKFG